MADANPAPVIAGPAPVAGPAPAAIPAAPVPIRLEQVKLPEFHGTKHKDAITARQIISRVNEAQAASGWTDEQTFAHFKMSLRGEALGWVDFTMSMVPRAQKTWTFIEPLFKTEFADEQDDRAIVDQITDIKFTRQDNVRTYTSKVHQTMLTLESLLVNTPPEPLGGFPDVMNRNQYLELANKAQLQVMEGVRLLLWKAGLPSDLKAVVSQQKPATMADAFKVANAQFKLREAVPVNEVHTHLETEDADTSSNHVQAVYNGGFRPKNPNSSTGGFRSNNFNSGQRRQNNQQGNSGNSSTFRTPQNQQRKPTSSNNGSKYCIFCQFQGHDQDECRKRKAAGKPCRTARGKSYFPQGEKATVGSVDPQGGHEEGVSYIASSVNQDFQARV